MITFVKRRRVEIALESIRFVRRNPADLKQKSRPVRSALLLGVHALDEVQQYLFGDTPDFFIRQFFWIGRLQIKRLCELR